VIAGFGQSSSPKRLCREEQQKTWQGELLAVQDLTKRYLHYEFERGAGLYGGHPYADSLRSVVHPIVVEWGGDSFYLADSCSIVSIKNKKGNDKEYIVKLEFFNVREVIPAYWKRKGPGKTIDRKIVRLTVRENKIIPFETTYYSCQAIVSFLENDVKSSIMTASEADQILQNIGCKR